MEPLRLSDSELDIVLAAARPLDVAARDGFLQDVAAALAALPERGATVASIASCARCSAGTSTRPTSHPDHVASSRRSDPRARANNAILCAGGTKNMLQMTHARTKTTAKKPMAIASNEAPRENLQLYARRNC
jgi:hypothetical protein